MSIRDPHKFVASIWDWKFLDERCFPCTNIRVGDVDGLVERHGDCLLIETKGPSVNVPIGQQILFECLARKLGFTVLVIWGHPNQPEYMQPWYPFKLKPSPCIPASSNSIIEFVSTWFRWATKEGESTHKGSRYVIWNDETAQMIADQQDLRLLEAERKSAVELQNA